MVDASPALQRLMILAAARRTWSESREVAESAQESGPNIPNAEKQLKVDRAVEDAPRRAIRAGNPTGKPGPAKERQGRERKCWMTDDYSEQPSPRLAKLLDEHRRAPVALMDLELRFRTSVMQDNLGPAFEVEAERSRTIITISGGALVASISIFQVLVADADALQSRWILGLSWVLFALAILFTLGTLRHVAVMRSFPMFLYMRRGEIAEAIFPIEDDNEAVDTMLSLVNDAVQEADERVANAARLYRRWGYAGAMAFIAAFFSLLLFALANLYT
jgi:hypothetical protein